MEKRAKRIVETAMRLAEKGGFAAVRLRDVASEAGVALGTVYKRFQSKEDILVAALELLYIDFKQYLKERPYQEASRQERIATFFEHFTTWLIDRPGITRAVLRAMAAGEPELAEKIALFHGKVAMMIGGAILGPEEAEEVECDFGLLTQEELELTFLLQHIWFASMVGWSSGLTAKDDIVPQIRRASELFLLGIEAQKTNP